MDDHALTPLLAQLRATPLPAVPGSLQQDVWREIRQRRAEKPVSWWASLFEPLLRPAPAFAALAVAVLVGVSGGSMAMNFRSAHTRHALGLEVFSSAAPALPATLLGHAQ